MPRNINPLYTYQEICEINKYLYGQEEALTYLIMFLQERVVHYGDYWEERRIVRTQVAYNLERMEFLWALELEFELA